MAVMTTLDFPGGSVTNGWKRPAVQARIGWQSAPPGATDQPGWTLGVSGHLAFGSGWITSFNYNEGVTQLDLRPAGNLLAAENARGRSYGVAIAKHGLFGDDALGLAVTRPSATEPGRTRYT